MKQMFRQNIFLVSGQRAWNALHSWRHLQKMAGIEEVVTVCYVRELVEEQEKTRREVSDILRQEHPGVQGLSERSVRRYFATNGIRRHDSHLTRGAVDEVVASTAAEVRVHVFNI